MSCFFALGRKMLGPIKPLLVPDWNPSRTRRHRKWPWLTMGGLRRHLLFCQTSSSFFVCRTESQPWNLGPSQGAHLPRWPFSPRVPERSSGFRFGGMVWSYWKLPENVSPIGWEEDLSQNFWARFETSFIKWPRLWITAMTKWNLFLGCKDGLT